MFKHLNEENLSYFNHMKRAMRISFKLLFASILCFIHSIFPFIFTKSASKICKEVVSSK